MGRAVGCNCDNQSENKNDKTLPRKLIKGSLKTLNRHRSYPKIEGANVGSLQARTAAVKVGSCGHLPASGDQAAEHTIPGQRSA